jgi:hypothetical protein
MCKCVCDNPDNHSSPTLSQKFHQTTFTFLVLNREILRPRKEQALYSEGASSATAIVVIALTDFCSSTSGAPFDSIWFHTVPRIFIIPL